MKFSQPAALAAVALMAFAGQASAMDVASVQSGAVKGSVVVDRGGRVTPLASNAVLQAGDRVIAMDGSEAQVRFADGCAFAVRANSVATVGAQSPCAASGLSSTSTPMDFGEGGTLLLGFLAVALVTWGFFEVSDSGDTVLSP